MTNGFTINEVLIVCVIAILVFVSVFSVLNLGYKHYLLGSQESELLQNGRIVFERLSRELRQTNEIITALPQTRGNPDSPEPSEIEFQDGHTPSPYGYLNSPYYYIRYYLATSTGEVFRQYKVYCFDNCALCYEYFKWNDTRLNGEAIEQTQGCVLEEKIIAEFVNSLLFWGSGTVGVALELQKGQSSLPLETKIFGRNF